MRGPSASKALKRRDRADQGASRRRHRRQRPGADPQALRQRASRIEGYASTLIPKPALLRKRLEMTGKDITLGKYAMICLGIAFVVASALMMRGARSCCRSCSAVLRHRRPALHHRQDDQAPDRKVQFELPGRDRTDGSRLRSGLPITETLGIVAGEIGGPVGIEFRAVSDKMKIGRTMEAALQDTADRLGTPEFQFFVITLAIQRETGGNLAETLSNLADVLRKRAQMKLKIRAMSSESKASAYIVARCPSSCSRSFT
jgi:tight adherence protein B